MRLAIVFTIFMTVLTASSFSASADEKLVRLVVPDELVESGLMKYMLPRFSLKTQVKVEIVPTNESAHAALGKVGIPVFEGLGKVWALSIIGANHQGAERFESWITSDVGKRAIVGFKVDGISPFSLTEAITVIEEENVVEGDAILGLALARQHCGRCHVTTKDQSGFGIGSTPSFSAMRTFDDWLERFSIFYVLAPHGVFTQITDVTEPFPPDLPPPITPVEITLDDLDALLAYVSGIEPADLGEPVRSQ